MIKSLKSFGPLFVPQEPPDALAMPETLVIRETPDVTFEEPWAMSRKERHTPWIGTVSQTTSAHVLSHRLAHGVGLLAKSVNSDPLIQGGRPCLAHTGIPVSQILAQFAEGDTVEDFVSDMEVDRDTLISFLNGMALILDRPLNQ
jgi:uncharacterized protein (DUF433 family)